MLFRTYVDTILTTSTIVVTECAGGSCGGEVTVTYPDTTVGTTTQVEVTYTTTCPVTVRNIFRTLAHSEKSIIAPKTTTT